MNKLTLLQTFVFLFAVFPIHGQTTAQERAQFFHAIGTVESNHDDNAVGDGGASIGRYQIQRAYWIDATQHDPTIGGEYSDVTDPAYARRIMVAYFDRYAPGALERGDWERLARIHNGGPRGHLRNATLPYWEKVRRELE